MRSFLRTVPRQLWRDVAALAAAVTVVGISFGAISVAAGLSTAQTVVMSATVFAGGAQFLAVGVIGAGGTAVAAVVGGLVLNARHLPFGLAIGDAIGRHRLIGSHLMVDEAVAFALARTDGRQRRQAFWVAGTVLYLSWNTGTLVGAVAGGAVSDPDTFGIDAAFPAGMLALVLPAVQERRALRVAVGGAAVALAVTPFLPPGLPVLAALLGLALALPVPGRRDTAGAGRRADAGEHR